MQAPAPRETPDGTPPTTARLDLLTATLALALIAVAFAPWTTSGTVDRNGWATAASALRLEAVDGPARILTTAWILVPPMVAAAGLAIALGRRRLGAGVVMVVGVVGAGAGLGVKAGALTSSGAPIVAAIVGCALVGCGSRMLVPVISRDES